MMRYYIILHDTILYYTILYYTILYYTILYYTILYYTILYYTIPYYTILLYYIILYDIILCGIRQLQPPAIRQNDAKAGGRRLQSRAPASHRSSIRSTKEPRFPNVSVYMCTYLYVCPCVYSYVDTHYVSEMCMYMCTYIHVGMHVCLHVCVLV